MSRSLGEEELAAHETSLARHGLCIVERLLDAIAAAMPRGSVLPWDGALWRGDGGTASDEVRVGLSLNYRRGWLRQQENQYPTVSWEQAAGPPVELQKLLGYATSASSASSAASTRCSS